MKVNVYDKNPGKGPKQWGLKIAWLLGCAIQKALGLIDDYYGASSWDDAIQWLLTKKHITVIQYWGHGTPGVVWLSGKQLNPTNLVVLKDNLLPSSIIWFRTCSTFRGELGHQFSEKLSNDLNCIIAGHTRIIGLLQGGLHTRKPNTPASWPIYEGEFKNTKFPSIKWGNNTIVCLATKIPDGW